MSDPATDPFTEVMRLLSPERVLHDPRATGEGVRVCVIDSGVDRGKLEERALARGLPCYPIETALFREELADPVQEPGQPSSPHGTTVADIVLGLAPRVRLYSADIFGPSGSTDTRVLIRAIRHAMNVWKCQVINLSLGITEQRLQPIQRRLELFRAIEEAYFRDVLVIAAAHNDHPVTRSYPAVFGPPLLSVDRGLFANPLDFVYRLREQVEFQAHARGSLGPFASESTTSWAAPHLTAIACRILSLRAGLKPFEMKTILYWMQHGSSASAILPR